MSLFKELKRRNVVRMAVLYGVSSWILLQVADVLFDALELPSTWVRLVLAVLILGFPLTLIFSWVYEMTPEGLRLESEIDRSQSITHVTAKRLDNVVIALLVLSIGLFVFQYVRPPQHDGATQSVSEALSTETATTVPDPAPGRTAVMLHEKSIAVLPFADMSADKDQEYMSDGIAEELMILLSKIPELQVAARTSSFYYKGKHVKLADVARELRVAHLLEGSVRKSGNKVRITAQLVRAADGYNLWSDSYDRTLDDVFEVQDQIAIAVVEQLKIKLLGATPRATPVNPEAYALYLQARQLYRRYTAAFPQAIELYQQALQIDPNYAAGWSGLADVYSEQAFLGRLPTNAGYRVAREAYDIALTISPDYALAHAGLGGIAMANDNDLAAAARHYEHAMALDPTNTSILLSAAGLSVKLGRPESAIELAEYAAAHDPMNPIAHTYVGWIYGMTGHLDRSITSSRTALTLSPDSMESNYDIGAALLLKGDFEGALTAMQAEPEDGWRLTGLAMAYHALGLTAASDAALAELISKHEKIWSSTIARVLAVRGEADRAFEWLDKAVANNDTGVQSFAVHPQLANLHDDPRWLPFLRKIGKAPEQLAAIKFDVTIPK